MTGLARKIAMRKNQVRCTRVMFMKYSSLVCEARIPHNRADLDRALDDLVEVIEMNPTITSGELGYWQEGLGWKLRARLAGDTPLARSRLAAKGWRYLPEAPGPRKVEAGDK